MTARPGPKQRRPPVITGLLLIVFLAFPGESYNRRAMDNAVPRESLNTADKIVVVEAPTEGASPVLVALREMALVLSTDVIDAGLQRYLQSHDLEPAGRTHEPFLV